MSVQKTYNGKWRAFVYDGKRNQTVGSIIGGSSTFEKKAEATAAVAKARERLQVVRGRQTGTLNAWYERWTSDKLFAREKESTNRLNRWAVKEFVDLYGTLPIRRIDHMHVSEYLAGGGRNYRVNVLSAMFSDAMRPEAGRLIDVNPFANLKLRKPKRKVGAPPSEVMVWRLIQEARAYGPVIAAWLQTACFTGMRPGELDALEWSSVDFEHETIRVRHQWNLRAGTLTAPKNGEVRTALMTPHAREALRSVQGLDPVWVFPKLSGGHFTPSSRRCWTTSRAGVPGIREKAGWDGTLYVATRHFAGWYMVNVLRLDSEDVAFALGHEDSGELVRTTYGHRNRQQGLERVAQAYREIGRVIPMPDREAIG